MIDIRPDQIQLFLEKVRKTFAGRVATFLKANHGDALATLPADSLEGMIRRQIAAAEGYGLVTEAAVVEFIEIGLAFGEDFHSSGKFPEAERVLTQELDPPVKIQQLREAAGRKFEGGE
jgi:hypothetical protein